MIRLGIVGCGRILAAHLRGYRLLRESGYDEFRITALCARRVDDARMYLRRGSGPPQRPAVSHLAGDPLAIGDEYLSDFQPETPVEVTDDYRRLCAEGPVDAVHDLTSHAWHHRVSGSALAHGKHTLTQKPLALTVAAARRLCERAETRGLTFGVFENFRFTPETRHLRWALDPARLGPVELALFGYVGAWWAPDRIVAETPWRHLQSEGGGISLDLGVHFFDQLRYVAGEIESVTAQTAVLASRRHTPASSERPAQEIECDADDTCLAQFRLEQGGVGSLVASWAGTGGPTLLGPGSVYYGRHGRVADGRVTRGEGTSHDLAEWFAREASAADQARWFPRGLSDSFALAQLDWLEAIRHGRAPETDGRQGLADLAAAFAILESAQAGQTVRVADVREGVVDLAQRNLNQHLRFDD